MSVATLSTASLNKLFLEYVKPGLETEFYVNTVLYDRFKTNTENCLGKYGVQKLMYSAAKSARPSSSSTFPTALQGGYSEFTFYMKRGMYATLQFDGLAVACGKGAGAVKELVKSEVEGITLYISHKLNKQFWGDGSGRLAITSAAATGSTSVTVDGDTTNWGRYGIDSNGYTDPSKLLFEGMLVDVYDSSGNLEVDGIAINSIALGGAGTDTLTMASAVTLSNNAYIFDADTYAASEAAGTGVPMGLVGIITTANPYVGITATSAFQGINRSTYTYAQAQVFNMGTAIGSPAVPTSKKLMEVVQKVERYGTVDVIITNDVIWRSLYVILEADKVISNEQSFWAGTAGLTFYAGRKKGIPIIYDEDCPDGSIYFLDSSKLNVVAPVKNGMDWLPGDSGNILTRVQGKDEYTANLVWYYNFTTSVPRALGLLRYVKHAEA